MREENVSGESVTQGRVFLEITATWGRHGNTGVWILHLKNRKRSH